MQTYSIYAVWFGERPALSRQMFYGDPHDAPVTVAYYVWVVTDGQRTLVVDLGFTPEVAQKRGRQIARPVEDGLRAIGVDPAAVSDVVITHFHYDHVGNYRLFPNAVFHVQDDEMQLFTGRYLRFRPYRDLVEIDDICNLVRLNYDGRLRFVDGDKQLLPGVTLHRVGGDSAALQAVRVATRRGYAVVASDAAHFYRNMEEHAPFPLYLTHSLPQVHEAFDRIQELADSPELIFPGHDPAVLERFEPAGERIVVLR